MNYRERFKKWFTLDHVVDLSVDIVLIIWDVITSPILIVMRLLRTFLGRWFTGKLKAGARGIAHYFERKREYRLEHNIGIIKTYWFLILSSPFILFGIALGVMFLIVGAELFQWVFDVEKGLLSDNPDPDHISDSKISDALE